MATIEYKCDTCKRSIEVLENTRGLSTFATCIITQGCSGKLRQINRNPNNSRETIPVALRDLDNFIPRKVVFDFSQQQPKQLWTINHSLGTFPAVVVYDTAGNVVSQRNYTLRNVSANIVEIVHTSPVSGTAQCIARTSVTPQLQTVTAAENLFRVSKLSTITLAYPSTLTRVEGSGYLQFPSVSPTPAPSANAIELPYSVCDNTSKIRIEIEVTQPNGSPVRCFERLDMLFDGSSPWFGWNPIVLKRRQTFCVMTKNLKQLKIFENINGDLSKIPNGTTLRFTRIDYGDGRIMDIENRGLIMLIADAPYETFDKATDRIIDLGDYAANGINAVFSFFDSELFVNNSAISKIYPEIERTNLSKRITPTPEPTPSGTPSPTPTPSVTITPSVTETPSPSNTPPVSPTATVTPTVTVTSSAAVTPTPTPSVTPSSSQVIDGCGDDEFDRITENDEGRFTEEEECRIVEGPEPEPSQTPTRTPTPTPTPTPEVLPAIEWNVLLIGQNGSGE